LANIVQRPLAKRVRAALASFRKLNDLTGDDFDDEIVSIRKSEGGACHLKCDAHDPLGLGDRSFGRLRNIVMDTRISR